MSIDIQAASFFLAGACSTSPRTVRAAASAVAPPAARAFGVARRHSLPSAPPLVGRPPRRRQPDGGVQLFDVNGESKTVPFWNEDQTVVVTFLRHFG